MKGILFFLFTLISTTSFSNNIVISNVSYNEISDQLSFTVSWENGFKISGSAFLNDCIWTFVKYAPNGSDVWYPTKILDANITNSTTENFIPTDSTGFAIFANSNGNAGPFDVTLDLDFMIGGFQDFKVFGIELVFIDSGGYEIGDAASMGRFYADGDTTSSWTVTNENAIMRGDGPGQFNQIGSTSSNNLSADFPKGYESHLCMKYKITAKQYVDFLNCLMRGQQENRIASDISGTTITNRYVMSNSPTMIDRNPIKCDADIGTGPITFYLDLDGDDVPNESNDGAHLPLNYLSPNDIMAYLDWIYMRPINEMEYEKLCRGEGMFPVANEYAWGTDTYNSAGSIINPGESTETTSNVGTLVSLFSNLPLRVGYSATPTSGRTDASSTFYGIMDVHNLGEFMLGVNSVNLVRTSYGDGIVDANGNAQVFGWQNNAEYLRTKNNVGPTPISKVKTTINVNARLATMGGRGMKRLQL